MPKCEWCGKSFDLEDAELEFDSETGILSYSNIKKCLCGACAIEAIEMDVDGVYFETCEKCGKTFDLIIDKSNYSNHLSWDNGTNIYDQWNDEILCADCAIEAYYNSQGSEEYEEYDETMDSGDEGCIACGNPAYPECKSSCPLFDD